MHKVRNQHLIANALHPFIEHDLGITGYVSIFLLFLLISCLSIIDINIMLLILGSRSF